MSFAEQALQAVRRTLEETLAGRPAPKLSFTHPRFNEHCGIFVTLKKKGELRGCIGLVRGIEPLSQAIGEMAVAAATQDPRFPPVKQSELDEIEIEISVLTPMSKATDLGEIKIGRDGLMLQFRGHSGLLLPQVAVEWGWNVDEFLDNLCHKAGLPPGSHLESGAVLMKFSAEIFSENSFDQI